MMKAIEEQLLSFITHTNWILFAASSLIGVLFFSDDVARGIIAGGLIVTINFHLLHRSLGKSFKPPHTASLLVVLTKYYLRLMVTGIILFILISNHLVNPLGLLSGLSVVVVSIIAGTIRETKRMLTSDAEMRHEMGEEISRLAYYGGLVFAVVIPIFLGLTVGVYLDRHVFMTSPRFTLVFLVFGVLVGFRSIAVMIKKIRRF